MFLKKILPFKPFTRRKLYFSILLSFIVMVFLVVLSNSLIFSGMYTQSLYNQLSSEYTFAHERLVDEFDNIFIDANDMNFFLRQNTDTNSFLLSINQDYATINRADNYLKQTHYVNRYLRSIFLYNRTFDYPIISGNVDININQFINEKLRRPDITSRLNIVISSSTPNGMTGVGTLDTLSIIFTDTKASDGITDHAIIMNIDREEVEKKLLGLYEGITLVADNKGRVILHSYNYSAEPSILDEGYFRQIISSGEIVGSFNIKLDKDDKIVTYRKSLMTDFYLINIRSLNAISVAIKEKRNDIILTSILILLFFVIAGYFISKRIYSPIKRVTEMISGLKFTDSGDKMGEIATISKVFTQTIEHLHELEIKSEDRNSSIKEKLFQSLLKANSIPSSIETELMEYKPRIEFTNLILISMKIDNYNQIDSNDRFAYLTTFCRTIPEFLSEDFNCETADMFEGEIAILLNYKNNEENNFNSLLTAMDKIRDVSRKTLHISLTIGIGGIANSISECTTAYKKAVEMVKHRFVLGIDNTYYHRYLEDHLEANLIYPAELEKKLVKSIMLNKKDAFLENLQNVIDLLRQYYYSEAVSAFFQITTACIKTVNQVTSQMNNMFYLGFDDITSIFLSLQTLDQAKDWLVKIFDEYQQMLDEITRLKGSKHYKMIEKMQEYIKLHYHDINLSVESLADIAGYTSYYFSKLFKDITGMNVTDYVKKIRINKAKELLGKENCKINEVPALIGFTNISHFYSVFKKDVGLTPSSFREYILQNR